MTHREQDGLCRLPLNVYRAGPHNPLNFQFRRGAKLYDINLGDYTPWSRRWAYCYVYSTVVLGRVRTQPYAHLATRTPRCHLALARGVRVPLRGIRFPTHPSLILRYRWCRMEGTGGPVAFTVY